MIIRDEKGRIMKGSSKIVGSGMVVGGWNKGMKHTEETKIKMSISHLGSKNAYFGKKHDEEAREKMRKNHYDKKPVLTDEERLEHKRFWGQRYKAIKKMAIGKHTYKEWDDLKMKFGNKCLSCGSSGDDTLLTEDHIVPLSRGGSDYISNIQPLCLGCNLRKNNKTINFATKIIS